MIRRALLSLIVFLSTGAAGAAPVPGGAQRESAETLYRYAGLERQIPMLGRQIEQQLRSESSAIPAALHGRMALAVRQAYDEARLKAEILGELRTNWNATLAADALTWLRSPAGRKVIEMEERASTPESQRAVEAYAVSLASSPPDPKRLAAMRQLDQATRATDISLAIMSTMARAIVRGAAAAQPGPASMGDFEQAIAAQEPAMRRAAETYTLTAFLYTYQELSPQELAAYLAFFDSPGGKWYQQTVGSAFQGAVENASERFAAELVRIMPTEP